MPLRRWFVCASLLAASTPGLAAECGTVVVPAGVGSSDPTPVDSLDPVVAPAGLLGQQLYRLLYRPLVWTNGQHEIDWTQSLASSIAVADGGASYRVTLKDYRWSDGVPVTADDVVYCWELIRTLGRSWAFYGSGGLPLLVRSMTADGPHRLEVRLTRPVNPEWFEIAGLFLLHALPRHAWGGLTIAQQQSWQSDDRLFKVVDGPFRLEHLAVGRYASFVPNETYGGHRPSIRRLVVTFLQGTDQLAELQAGQVDMTDVPFPVWDAARALAGFAVVPLGPSARYSAIIPNLRSPRATFLADVRVRRAMAMAIDQAGLVRTVFHGNALPNPGFVPGALTDFLSPEMRSGHTPVDHDPAGARALLDGLGWRAGGDGVRSRDGVRLAFDVLTTAANPVGLTMLQLIRNDLAAIGVDARIREAEFNQVIARMVGPAVGWDATFISWTTESYPDGAELFGSGSTANFEHYGSPLMDRMLDQAVFGSGREGLFALEDYVVDQQPMIFLPAGFYSVLVRPEIGGVHEFLSPSGAWSPEYLTVSGSLACR